MQLKHLFVFLLVFLLSVADTTVYSQKSSSSYYQSSKVVQLLKRSFRNTKHISFKQKLDSNSCFFVSFFSKLLINEVFQKQTNILLKHQKHIYLNIASFNIQYLFLINTITSSKYNSKVYIA